MKYNIILEKKIGGRVVKLIFDSRNKVVRVKRVSKIDDIIEPEIDIIDLDYKSANKGEVERKIGLLYNVVNQIFDQERMIFSGDDKKEESKVRDDKKLQWED